MEKPDVIAGVTREALPCEPCVTIGAQGMFRAQARNAQKQDCFTTYNVRPRVQPQTNRPIVTKKAAALHRWTLERTHSDIEVFGLAPATSTKVPLRCGPCRSRVLKFFAQVGKPNLHYEEMSSD